MNLTCIRSVLLFILVPVFTGSGCSHDTGKYNDLLRFTDDIGRPVELKERPQRIVSLAPNVTEILFFLGEGGKLVGVTNFCDWPPDARSIPRIGDFSYPNIERIVASTPDLVISTALEQDRWIEKMAALGIPVYTVYPEDCDDLIDSMSRLLHVLGETEQGLDSILALEERLADLENKRKDIETDHPRVFLEISDSPLMTAGDDSFVSDLLVRAGGENIAGNLERDYCVINPERVISEDPDIIFLFHGRSSGESVGRRIGWGEIGAVLNSRIYDDIDPDIVLRPGPRVYQGISEMRARMYGNG